MWCRVYPNANFANRANGRNSIVNGQLLIVMRGTRNPNAPPFVIPNIVRNLAREKNEIHRFALNDKLIVNCQWLIVMPGTRNPNATLCHSEHREESREGKEKRFFAYALNDKLIVNCQWLIVMRGTRNPNAEKHPPQPPFKGGKSGAKRWGNRRTPRRSSLRPRAVSRRSSEQGERKSGCPKRSKLPDFPTCKRREGV